jgi:hypothetical protein
MAIRPVDLQATILQATQTAQVQRQAEVASQTAQSIAGQQFAAKVEERSETVQESEELRGNRVEEKREPDRQDARRGRRARRAGEPFESIEESVRNEVAASDGDHLIDFTA